MKNHKNLTDLNIYDNIIYYIISKIEIWSLKFKIYNTNEVIL